MTNLNNKVLSATKWSSVTEIAAKLVTPISTMVLARLLTPEAFGVLVTVTMVISFAEIFTDAGFQKYLIQHKFESDETLYKSTTVAFWSNLILSLIIWIVIICYAEDIAVIVGNPGRGDVIAVSCFCIPLAAFSSIQMALFKRSLDFKTLFWVRIIGVLIPLFITIPVAYFTRSYWALIIGIVALNLSNAIILTIKSNWKPNKFYSLKLLKRMFSYSIWSMLEAISIWMTGYIDIFIVGTMLSQYYLGIYRTSMTTVGQIMGLITAATTPVLFSSLSKLQDDDKQLKQMFFSFQKMVSLLIIPLGMGIFLFKDFITSFLLGNQWTEASYFIGLWGVTSSFTIVLSHYCSEVFRAKGKPKLSVLSQILHMGFLIPTVLWAVKQDFYILCEARSLVRLTSIFISSVLLYKILRITFIQIIKNIMPSIVAVIPMSVITYFLVSINTNPLCQVTFIIIAIIVYCSILFVFPKERNIVFHLKDYLKK